VRKFCARWWVADPLARWRAECDWSEHGIPLRFIRTATLTDGWQAFLAGWKPGGFIQ
jgi:hypothetical protein